MSTVSEKWEPIDDSKETINVEFTPDQLYELQYVIDRAFKNGFKILNQIEYDALVKIGMKK